MHTLHFHLMRSVNTVYFNDRICSPVRAMNRTVMCRSVAVPWSLFPRELSVGQVLSLSLLWRGHDCRTLAVVCTSSQQGQRADFSIPIFFMWLRSLQWPVLSRNIMVCSWHDSKRRVSCWGL